MRYHQDVSFSRHGRKECITNIFVLSDANANPISSYLSEKKKKERDRRGEIEQFTLLIQF